MADITLSWNPSEGADGYKLYYGSQSKDYAPPIDIGNVTVYELKAVESSVRFFAVTAYNRFGESAPSEEAFLPRAPEWKTIIFMV
jgi:hypothetical protein